MSSYQFKDTKKTLDVQAQNGEVIKTFTVDVGNYNNLKRWSKELEKVQSAAELLKGGDNGSEYIDDLKQVIMDVLGAVLGDDAYEVIWKASGENVLSCLSFIYYLSGFLEEQIAEIKKSYA